MKIITIKTIERVAGHTMAGWWKKDMWVVNGEYVASTIDRHNINAKEFDLEVGETVEVTTRLDPYRPNTTWIARATKPKQG